MKRAAKWLLAGGCIVVAALTSCGGSSSLQGNTSGGRPSFPLFDPSKDGPILKEPKTILVHTTAGDLELVLTPNAAPFTATQMSKLFANGAFNGTRIHNVRPNYYVAVSPAQIKARGNPPMPKKTQGLLRRLPLEVHSRAQHKTYALSMMRNRNIADSAVSGFVIMLRSEPSFDSQYTVFGYASPNAKTKATLDKIVQQWDSRDPSFIVSTGVKSK